MKSYIPIIGIIFLIVLYSFYSPPVVSNSTERISQAEFDSLVLDYKSKYPDNTWGGVLNKDSILQLVNAMNADSTEINYIFNTDVEFNKVAIAMRSSANPVPLCYKNGKVEAAFCPDSCNLSNTTVDGTLKLSYETYKTLYQDYVNRNTNTTYGGSFDKDAMILILASLSSNNLNFRFYYDSKYRKIGIIFIGGVDEKNETIYYKNGKTYECFCPNTCPD
jgi:hypothetical protein